MLTQADKDFITQGNAQIKTQLNDLKASARTQAIFLEDLESRLTTICEAIDQSFDSRAAISSHDIRLASIESVQSLMRRTLREHARRLNFYEH